MGDGGQSTVEYAVVLFAFLASVVVLGRVLSWAGSGGLVGTIVESLSHLTGNGLLGALRDVLLY